MAGRGCTCTPGGVYCPQCAGYLARAVPQRPSLPAPPVVTAAPPLSETQFLRQVLDLAALGGWRCYHPYDSRHSASGFPDLCLVRTATPTQQGRLLFVELKSRQGKVTPEQHAWLEALAQSLPGIEVYLWRPADWDDIVHILLQK